MLFRSVLAYIAQELEQDEIQLENPIYQRILLEAIEKSEQSNFEPQRYFINHRDPEISRVAANMISEPYELSKIHHRFQEVVEEKNRLDELIPHILLDLKYALVDAELQALHGELRKATGTKDETKIHELFVQIQDLLEIKKDKEGNLDEQFQIDNRNLILIESCLRVTYTSSKNMHWIGQVLSELDKNEEVNIVLLLEKYASKKVKEAEYTKTTGFGIQRIVFNFLDYILAKNYEEYANYSFRFRNSIEHFYPQHPSEGEYWEDEDLNSLGNLALLSVSENSRFSNLPPMAKYEYLKSVVNQNPKLNEMAKLMNEDSSGWTQEKAKNHKEEMFKLLEENISD